MSDTFDGIEIQDYLPIRMDVDPHKGTRQIFCCSCGEQIASWGPEVEYNPLAKKDFFGRYYQGHMEASPRCIRRRIVEPK